MASLLKKTGIFYAIIAAVLFGASTPCAKLLLKETSPWLLAGVLYFGSGVGLAILFLFSLLKKKRAGFSQRKRLALDVRSNVVRWNIGTGSFNGGT
jgi:drug/metabolite transporter (DMT)-like permease